MTIVSNLKTHFAKLDSSISELFGVSRLDFNGRRAKHEYSYWGESRLKKAIKSDHIRIYPINKFASFAFAFNDLKSGCPTIDVTVKIKGDIQLRTFDYEDFKELLKVFNNELGGLSEESRGKVRSDKLFSLIKKTFSISKKTVFELDADQSKDAKFIVDGISEI